MEFDHATSSFPTGSTSFQKLARLAAFATILSGVLVLIGWVFDVARLRSVLPGAVDMKTNTALGFLLSGLSLWLLGVEAPPPARKYLGRACAGAVLLIGALTLSRYLLGRSLGIDQLLASEPKGAFGTLAPNRMAPTSALNFVIIGLACGEGPMLNRRLEMPAVRADSSDLMVELTVVPIPVKGEGGPLFTGYLRDITERKQAEEELAARARYETGLAACSRALLTIGEPGQALNRALEHLLQASDVSRVCVFENFEDARDGLCMRQTHEVCSPGVHPEIDNPALQHVPYSVFEHWRGEMEAGRAVSGIVHEMEPQERAILEAQGILSILVLPIWAGSRWHGFIGFDDVRQSRPWSEAKVQLLHTAAGMVGTFIERKRAQSELQHSFSLLQATLESTADGILVVDTQAQVAGFNRKFSEMWRVPPRLLESKDDEPVLSWVNQQLADPPAFLRRVRELYADTQATSFDVLHLKDGRVFERYSQPQLIGGQNAGRVWSFRDVSERVQAEAALRESEERYRRLIETAQEGIWMVDADYCTAYVNERMAAMLGYGAEEMVGHHLLDFLFEEDRPAIEARIAERKSGKRSQYDFRYRRKDGSEVWMLCSTSPLQEGGGFCGAFGMLTDITERRRAEEELRRRAEFEALIASISTSFIDLPSSQIDQGIWRALQALGEFTHVDRSYVFLWSDDGRLMSNTHEWCAPGVEPQIERLQDLPVDAFPWVCARLRSFETVHIPRVCELPDEARAEREEFEIEEIQSIVLVPMIYRGRMIGHLGFDSVRVEKAWSDDDISLLRIAGEMFVNALERKRAEESLRGSEARNRALLNAIPDLITRVHRDGTILDLVPAQEFDPAVPPEVALGRNVRDLFSPELAEQTLLCMQRALASHGVETLEYQLPQDGETAFFEARIVASGSDEVTAIVRDVSARKRAETEILRLNESLEQRVQERTLELAHANAQLQQERARMADTLSNLPGIVFENWFQPDPTQGRIDFVSDHVTTMLGYSMEEWMSAPDYWMSKIYPDDREQLQSNMAQLPEGTGGEHSIYRMIAKDGRLVWNESQMRVMRGPHGEPLGVRGVSMDITQRKRAEAELEAARDEADRANAAKSEFLSRMSHELRTPLNAILGFGQILEMGTLSRSQREGVEYILKAGRHLLDLINEVLEIARIEAGHLSLSPEPIWVKMAVSEVLDLARPLAAGHSIHLVSEVPEHSELYILADQQRLKQVLLNLVSNAVKYNREGGGSPSPASSRPRSACVSR